MRQGGSEVQGVFGRKPVLANQCKSLRPDFFRRFLPPRTKFGQSKCFQSPFREWTHTRLILVHERPDQLHQSHIGLSNQFDTRDGLDLNSRN